MNRLLPIAAAGLIGAAGLATPHAASASADDQAAADSAIAAFNERMLDAGGESNGPPDTTPVDPEEYAAENPGSECFGEFLYGLDPSGRLEGETARAFSDNFSFPAPEDSAVAGSDEVSAGVITVDEAHRDGLVDLVEMLGSEDVATCVEEAFTALMVAASSEAPAASGAPEETGTVDMTGETDLGVGDASAQARIAVTTTFDGTTYEYNIDVYAAVVDRSVVYFNITTAEAPVSDLDGAAELEALADSL